MIYNCRFLTLCVAASLFLGCGSISTAPNKVRSGDYSRQAYGRKWNTFHITEYYTKTFTEWIHGANGVEKHLWYLEDDRGYKISIDDSIYVLQKSGKFEKYNRFKYHETRSAISNVSLLDIDDKLFIFIEDDKIDVTDCNVHPPNHIEPEIVDNRLKYRKRSMFFGEFNPIEFKFYVNEYVPNFDEGELKKLRESRSFNYEKYYYKYKIKFY